MPAQRIILAVGQMMLAVEVHLVGGDHQRHTHRRQIAQGIEHMGGAHDIGGKGFNRGVVAHAHQRLRRQMQHDLGLGLAHDTVEARLVADIADVALHGALDIGQHEQIGARAGGKGDAGDNGPLVGQPERQPAPLETGVSGDKDAFSSPEVRICYHFFQGALPEAQRSSSMFFSRRVSMGCQKPSCWKA